MGIFRKEAGAEATEFWAVPGEAEAEEDELIAAPTMPPLVARKSLRLRKLEEIGSMARF